jgi:hypothetical protein
MMPRKYYLIEGQSLTREEAEAKYGLSMQNLLIRIKRGIPLDTPVRTYGQCIPVEYEGETYRSITCLAHEFDINAATLSARIRGGMTAQEAVTAILANREQVRRNKRLRAECAARQAAIASARLAETKANPERQAPAIRRAISYPKHYTHQGRTLTPTQWAKEAGLPSDRVRERLIAGWTVERAITQPIGVSPPKAKDHTPGGHQPTSQDLEGTGAGSRLLERGDLKLPNETENEVT